MNSKTNGVSSGATKVICLAAGVALGVTAFLMYRSHRLGVATAAQSRDETFHPDPVVSEEDFFLETSPPNTGTASAKKAEAMPSASPQKAETSSPDKAEATSKPSLPSKEEVEKKMKEIKHQLLHAYKIASFTSPKDFDEGMAAIETLVKKTGHLKAGHLRVKAGADADVFVKNIVAECVRNILEGKHNCSKAEIRKYKDLIDSESKNKVPVDLIALKVKLTMDEENQKPSRRRRLSAEVVLGPLLAEISAQ